MFIVNNYILAQSLFVKQFLFFSDKLYISLIILEPILCTCFSLNSINSSFFFFFGMFVCVCVCVWHESLKLPGGAAKGISAVPCAMFSVVPCVFCNYFGLISLVIRSDSSSSSKEGPPIFCLHFPSTVSYYSLLRQYFIPFLLLNSLLFSLGFFLLWQCSQALTYQYIKYLNSFYPWIH